MKLAVVSVPLAPAVPADIKIAAEEVLIHRLEKLSQGIRQLLRKTATSGGAGGTSKERLFLKTRFVATSKHNAEWFI